MRCDTWGPVHPLIFSSSGSEALNIRKLRTTDLPLSCLMLNQITNFTVVPIPSCSPEHKGDLFITFASGKIPCLPFLRFVFLCQLLFCWDISPVTLQDSCTKTMWRFSLKVGQGVLRGAVRRIRIQHTERAMMPWNSSQSEDFLCLVTGVVFSVNRNLLAMSALLQKQQDPTWSLHHAKRNHSGKHHLYPTTDRWALASLFARFLIW